MRRKSKKLIPYFKTLSPGEANWNLTLSENLIGPRRLNEYWWFKVLLASIHAFLPQYLCIIAWWFWKCRHWHIGVDCVGVIFVILRILKSGLCNHTLTAKYISFGFISNYKNFSLKAQASWFLTWLFFNDCVLLCTPFVIRTHLLWEGPHLWTAKIHCEWQLVFPN